MAKKKKAKRLSAKRIREAATKPEFLEQLKAVEDYEARNSTGLMDTYHRLERQKARSAK